MIVARKTKKHITMVAYIILLLQILSLIITIIIFVAPGWAWTVEAGTGAEAWEGEYYR